MVKSYKPITLDLDQALKTIDNCEKNKGFQSVLYGIEGQFIPSEHKTLNKRYIRNLYRAGGYMKSTTNLINEEKTLYLDPAKLIHNPQFVLLLEKWNRSDLANALKKRQRISGRLRQSISTENQRRLIEVFQLLFPADIRQEDQYKKSALGGKSSKKSKEISHQDVIGRTKARAKSLLAKHDRREIASIIANEEGVTSRTIRDRLKK